MLVVTRKANETIVINDDVQIVILEVRGDKVRLGIELPDNHPSKHKATNADSEPALQNNKLRSQIEHIGLTHEWWAL